MDESLERLIQQIRLFSSSFSVEQEGVTKKIPLEDIFYFDTADNKTYMYLKSNVYPCNQKLYEIEHTLRDTTFVRIGKNCILNVIVVISVRAQFSGRLEATLRNGEKVIVSKHYMRKFRQKIEQEASE